MLSEQQRERAVRIICETLRVEPQELEQATDFGTDLGASSLDRLHLMAAVEVEFDVHIDESRLEGLHDLPAVFAALDEVLNG